MTLKPATDQKLAHAALCLALFALYLVTHPYRGIHSDALIYVTRAFASPELAASDMLFAHERQTGLTLFTLLLTLANKVWPVDESARLLALCGAAVWFAGVVVLCRAVAQAAKLQPRMSLAMVALVTLAPLGYSVSSAFVTGETLAVPRPFAEGLVLAGLAALLKERWGAAAFALLGAIAFHPLMGGSGLALAFTFCALREPRLWLVAVAAAMLALVGIAAGLVETFDPQWLAWLRARTSYLFLSQAPVSFWADNLLRGAILLIAAPWSAGGLRRLLIAGLVASALAIIVSLLFADLWPTIWITRLQPWRILFIPTILAPAALMLVACNAEARRARITLALIACALLARDAAWLSMIFSLCAIAFQFVSTLATRRAEALVWLIVVAAFVGFDLMNLLAFRQIIADAPPDFQFPWSFFWVLRPLAAPLAGLVILLATRSAAPRAWMAAGALAATMIVAFLRFDDRAPVDISLESRQAPALVAAMPEGEGAVLWLGVGKEPWYWLGRANWLAPVQASSIVFSRELARDWNARALFLVEIGMLAPEVLRNLPVRLRMPIESSVAAVCARDDAPAFIVAPLQARAPIPSGARRIAAPAPSFEFQAWDRLSFDIVESYAVWTCMREASDQRT